MNAGMKKRKLIKQKTNVKGIARRNATTPDMSCFANIIGSINVESQEV